MGKYNCTAGLWVDRFEYLQEEHLKLDAFFLDWWNPIQSNWKPAVGILVPTHLKGTQVSAKTRKRQIEARLVESC